VAEKPIHLVGNARPASRADIDPDLEPAAVDADARAGGSPFDTARRSRPPVPWSVLAVVSAGGVAGSLARYGLGQACPPAPTGFHGPPLGSTSPAACSSGC